MKKKLLAFVLLNVSLGVVRADTNQMDAVSSISALAVKRISPFMTLEQAPSHRLLGMRVSYGGALVAAVQEPETILHPPAAPAARTAAVLENVSVHPRTGRAQGVALFSIKF